MKTQLINMKEKALSEIESIHDLKMLENVRIEYLGKKGVLTTILRSMGQLSSEERPLIGKIANDVRESIEKMLAEKKSTMEDML